MSRILVSMGLAGALIATGCGSGEAGQSAASPSAATAPATGSLSAQQETLLVRQLVRCVRANGVPNFPDLVKDERTGEWERPPGVREPPKSVLRKCTPMLDRLKRANAGRGGDEQRKPLTAAEMAKTRQHSDCMRRHGLADWPDPDASGTAHLPRRYERLVKAGIRSQLVACQKYIVPGTGITIDGGRE